MESAIKCPICESLVNAVPVNPTNVDKSGFSTEIFSALRLPDSRLYQSVQRKKCTLLYSDLAVQVDFGKFVGVMS